MGPAAVAFALVIVSVIGAPIVLGWRSRRHRGGSAQDQYRRHAAHLRQPGYGASLSDIFATDRHGAPNYGGGGGNGGDGD